MNLCEFCPSPATVVVGGGAAAEFRVCAACAPCSKCEGNDREAGYDRCLDCLVASGVVPDPKDLVCPHCGEAEPCTRRTCLAAGRYESRMP